ncbi:MAG: class II fructose-bisphosphate aldolase [Dehalococcoidales bacterium]|nr:class II fructose-bisphosphate aldolase [Dehalococcoidales bacterium]
MTDNLDSLVLQVAFAQDAATKREIHRTIRRLADGRGVFCSSLQKLYEAASRGALDGVTVPAINIRGLTYHVARAVFRAAKKEKAGIFIFEIARSEMEYTRQSPAEYAACVLAAAMREDYSGPVFLQGDHYQVRRAMYRENPHQELDAIRKLIQDSIDAGFYNIDIDASTLVDLSRREPAAQQETNYRITAEMTHFIRSIEPEGITICIGGEIGEIGRGNSTPEDLKAFMDGYLAVLGSTTKGIAKLSVQTGTTHGGIVLPDGSIAEVSIDFATLRKLSRIAREEYGLGGVVQHGASTLPDSAFDMFPEAGTLEVHLATGFQNIIFDSPHFPPELLAKIREHLLSRYRNEMKEGETEPQFLYKTRKRAFGDFKRELWEIPPSVLEKIMTELEARFSLIFRKLNINATGDLVRRYILAPPEKLA